MVYGKRHAALRASIVRAAVDFADRIVDAIAETTPAAANDRPRAKALAPSPVPSTLAELAHAKRLLRDLETRS